MLARKNIGTLAIRLVRVFQVVRAASSFINILDLIVSNPPYVPSSLVASVAPELSYESPLALYAGEDGMETIRSLLSMRFCFSYAHTWYTRTRNRSLHAPHSRILCCLRSVSSLAAALRTSLDGGLRLPSGASLPTPQHHTPALRSGFISTRIR